jgi:hypothetical protein
MTPLQFHSIVQDLEKQEKGSSKRLRFEFADHSHLEATWQAKEHDVLVLMDDGANRQPYVTTFAHIVAVSPRPAA